MKPSATDPEPSSCHTRSSTSWAAATDSDYRLFCEERLQNPHPLFHRLRTEDPVHWCEPLKLWLVTRYRDVNAGLRDPRLSSNRSGMYSQALPPELKQNVQPLLDHIAKWILFTEETEHVRLRKLVNLAFAPDVIGALRPRITQLAANLLDEVDLGKPFDIIEKFCCPLPAIVICELLGIPQVEREAFRLTMAKVTLFSTRGSSAICQYAEPACTAVVELIAMFECLVRTRREFPRNDLLSALVSAEADGERLSDEELYAMCVFIFFTGHETTTNAIATGILALLQHPEQLAALKANVDGLVSGLVEETLRYDTPVARAVRHARESMEIGGTPIEAGQHVVFLLGAANRDPHQFPDPDRFDIARQPNRHMAFGFGSHFCLGATLARLEMEIAFRALVLRLPDLRLTGEPFAWKPVLGLRALEALPVIAH